MLSDTSLKRELELLFFMNGCMNFVARPTITASHSGSLFNLFIKNADETNFKARVIISDISDYLPIVGLFKTQHRQTYNEEQAKCRSVTLSCLKELCERISLCNWNDVLYAVSPNKDHDTFLVTFIRLYKMCFSYKVIKTYRKIKKISITPNLLANIYFKNKLYKKILMSRNIEGFGTFKNFRNQLTK